MDAAESLADLKQISTQVDRAVIVALDGTVEASSVQDADAGARMAEAGVRLWQAADRARRDLGRPELAKIEVATPEGSVFAVREAERLIVATTTPDPTVGLIFYDLQTCLRNLHEGSQADERAAVEPTGDDDGPA